MKTEPRARTLEGIAFEGKRHWLVTGAAGFIGSHLVETLLVAGQSVTGLDNYSSGYEKNIQAALKHAGDASKEFNFLKGDIRDPALCRQACKEADYVLHHAALASVPRSIEEPLEANAHNVDGFANILAAARAGRVKRVVYASSSAVYGDDPTSPKREEVMGKPLSPYATTKIINELYADTWSRVYGLECVGLRYFNVFGPRQDPDGAYAAVIPKWIQAMTAGAPVKIFGDGETTRDFCYVKDVVRANLFAALAPAPQASGNAFNVACGEKTTLNHLFDVLKKLIAPESPMRPVYEDFRKGDVLHSLASIERARKVLGYSPLYTLASGLEEMLSSDDTL